MGAGRGGVRAGSRTRSAIWRSPGAVFWGGSSLAAAFVGVSALWERTHAVPITTGARALLETLIVVATAAVSSLFFLRWRGSRLRCDLLGTCAFLLLSVAGVLSAVASDMRTWVGHDGFIWPAFALRTIGLLLVVWAVLEHGRGVTVSGRVPRPLAFATAGAAVIAVSPPLLLGAVLPGLAVGSVTSTRLLIGVNVVLVPLLLLAARRALRYGMRRQDALLTWLGGMLMLLAFSRLSIVVHPTVRLDLLHPADVLRILAVGVAAVGCLLAAREQWRSAALGAVLQERERLAHELHDGIAQDLAFLSAQSRWLVTRPDDRQGLELIAEAAQRALAESRLAISSLRRDPGELLQRRIATAAESAGARVGCEVSVAVAPDVAADPIRVEKLTVEVRDHIVEAGRRGAHRVSVQVVMTHDGPVVLATTEPRDSGRSEHSERSAAPHS
jgi:signal transduction histidine kinase